jgi:hypothetical protein
VSSKPADRAAAEATFTADDLDRTIAHYRRVNAAARKVAAVLEEAAAERGPEYGRLPAGSQGPHSPTD